MVGILGAGDDNVATLNVPAENDLGRGLAVLLAKLSKQRFLKQRLVAMTQWIPRLRHDAVLLQEGLQLRLLMVGVQLCLQDSGLYFADREDFLDLFFVEVGQTNGTHLALLVRLLHLTVARHIITRGWWISSRSM